MESRRISHVTVEPALSNDVATTSRATHFIRHRFEEMEEAFNSRVEELETKADERVKVAQQQMEAKVQQIQRSTELKLTEHNAELSRLRHEASLMENRMLAALAKQANVAQEQIQTIHGVVQETLLTKGGKGGSGGGNKYNQLGSWEDDDDDSYSTSNERRGRVSVPRKLYDDVDDLIDLTKEVSDSKSRRDEPLACIVI